MLGNVGDNRLVVVLFNTLDMRHPPP